MSQLDPEYFIWTGDAVYIKNNSVSGLSRAYDELLQSAQYLQFRERTVVDGVWDDHGMSYGLQNPIYFYATRFWCQ